MVTWIEGVRCTHNSRDHYNQLVLKACDIVGLIRWSGKEWVVDRYKCRECGARFQQGKARQYKPVTYSPSLPNDAKK